MDPCGPAINLLVVRTVARACLPRLGTLLAACPCCMPPCCAAALLTAAAAPPCKHAQDRCTLQPGHAAPWMAPTMAGALQVGTTPRGGVSGGVLRCARSSPSGVACGVCTMAWSSRTPASTAPAVALCLRHSCYHRRHTHAALLAVSPPALPP